MLADCPSLASVTCQPQPRALFAWIHVIQRPNFDNLISAPSISLPPPHEHITMEDGASSPLFMPQGTPEGSPPPFPQRDEESGSGNGNGNGTGEVDVKSEHSTPEFQSNPQGPYTENATREAFWDDFNKKIAPIPGANNEPEVKDEQSPSPRPPLSSFPPTGGPAQSLRPFSPFTSRAERNRRKAANESANAATGSSNSALVRTALAAGSRDMETAAELAGLAARNAALHNDIARIAAIRTPDQAVATAALETSSRDLQNAVQLANLAARNASMHNDIARKALKGKAPDRPATQENAAPHRPQPAQQAKPATTPIDLLHSARHHLDTLSADLRKQENDACDREEHLATLLEHVREIRSHAIQDRKNGLVIIRDRSKKLEELEKKLLDKEEVDGEEMLELLRPLKLHEPVERETFEKMEVDGKGYERWGGYESG